MLDFNKIMAEYPAKLQPFGRHMLREYLQYKILEIVFTSKLAYKLSFLGETALRILYDNNRFSEDIDFDNFGLTEAEFKQICLEIKRGLELEGYEIEIRQIFKQACRCYIRFPNILYKEGLSLHKKEKVMIQIDTMAQGFDYKPVQKILNKFEVFVQILATPLDILLSQKIYAALKRKRAKGRDFYDIVFLLPKTKPNYAYLQKKLGIKDAKGLRKMVLNKSKELDFKRLAADVRPFLFSGAESKKVLLFVNYFSEVNL